MKLLHLDSSIMGVKSVSRILSAAIVERIRAEIPDIDVTYRDLAAQPLDHFTFSASDGTQSAEELEELVDAEASAQLDQFFASDIIVIGAGFYNFTIPSQLKVWIDRILIAGRTFRYGPNGAEGLAGGRRVIVGLARGGIYAAGSPIAGDEHAETLLRSVFRFIGIDDVQFVVADGVGLRGDRQKALDAALAQARQIVVEQPVG